MFRTRMRKQSLGRSRPSLSGFWTGLIALALLTLVSGRSQADPVVAPGWDLLQSTSGTTFAGQPFMGVPLGGFDFGGTIGFQSVGNADTIVQRLAPADVPGPVPPSQTADPIPIELVALQLVSVNPIDLGGGLGFHYITLQSIRGGPASAGQMTITFDSDAGGTFSSFFDVFFDVRLGSLDGPILLSDTLTLSSNNVPWDRTPDPDAMEITGVNRFLNGNNRNQDFWPDPFHEEHPSGAIHQVITAVAPEPGTLALAGIGALGLAAALRRRRLA